MVLFPCKTDVVEQVLAMRKLSECSFCTLGKVIMDAIKSDEIGEGGSFTRRSGGG